MCVDQFVLPRLLKVRRPVEPIPEWRSTAFGNWPAIVAVVIAVLLGARGQVLLPGQTPRRAMAAGHQASWRVALFYHFHDPGQVEDT